MTEVELKTSEPIVSFKETVVYQKLTQAKTIQKMQDKNFQEQEYEEEKEEEEESEQQKKLEIIKQFELDKEDFVDNTEKDEEPDIR